MNPTNEGNTATMPSTWPGAFGIYKYSRDAVKKNVWLYVGVIIASIVVSLLLSRLSSNGGGSYLLGQLLNIVFSLLTVVVTVHIMVSGVRGKSITLGEALGSNVPMTLLKLLGQGMVIGVLGTVSLLALIVPFFFVMPRLLLAPYYLVDKDMGVFESITASWNATKGSVGKVYGVIGASMLMSLIILTIIGIPLALYLLVMYAAAMAFLYEFLLHKPTESAKA